MAEKRNQNLSTQDSEKSSKSSSVKAELKSRAKMFKEKQKEEETNQKTTKYADMLVTTMKQAKRIQSKFPDLSVDTVSNIALYAKQLPKHHGLNIVDDLIFKAQMHQHFGISNTTTLERMYQVVARSDRHPEATLEQYIELICIFLSSDRIAKIVYVFTVFDRWGEGELSRRRIRDLVAPMIEHMRELEDENEHQEYVNFMANSLMTAMDKNNDDKIQLDEFESLVVNNPLMMECLGSCLPEEGQLNVFRNKVTGKSKIEVAGIFRNERRRSLRNPEESRLEPNVYKKLYGISIDTF